MDSARILWVYIENDGPMQGLAEFKGQKVWFSRITNPPITSSTDIPIPDAIDTHSQRSYALFHLSEQTLEVITADHIAYCQSTNTPINHGDPIKLSSKSIRTHTPKEGETPETVPAPVPGPMRSFVNNKQYYHNINITTLEGQFIESINESTFSNYKVPHILEM